MVRNLAFLFIAIFAACGAPAPGPSNQVVALTSLSEVGQILNRERAARGLGQVAQSVALDRAAAGHAAFLDGHGQLTHTGRGGSSVLQRIEAQGYRPCAWAENVAVRQQSASQVMTDWMNSLSHRRNNLNADVTHIGVARSTGDHWVLVFAAPC